MKKITRLLSLTLLLALILTAFASCGNASYIATTKDGTKISSAGYSFWAYYYKLQLSSQYTDAKSLTEYLNSTDTSTGTTSTKKNYTTINSEIQKAFETYYIYKAKATELKLSPNEQNLKNLDTNFDTFIEKTITEAKLPKLLSAMGITKAQYKEAYKDIVSGYGDQLINYYFGDKGEKKISDDTILKDFVRIKHILIEAPQSDDVSELTDEEKKTDATAKAKAESLLKEIKAGTKKFDTLMNSADVNKDAASLANYPDGYIFNKSASYVDAFKNAAFDMKVGEYRIVRSTYGYHIMLKEDLKPVLSKYKSEILPQIESVQTDFEKMVTEWKKAAGLKYNNAALKKFDIRYLKTIS